MEENKNEVIEAMEPKRSEVAAPVEPEKVATVVATESDITMEELPKVKEEVVTISESETQKSDLSSAMDEVLHSENETITTPAFDPTSHANDGLMPDLPKVEKPAEPDVPIVDGESVIVSNSSKKRTGVLFAVLAVVIVACLGIGSYFLIGQSNQTKTEIANPSLPENTDPIQKVEASDYIISGYGLGDFDLAFAKLENNGSNFVYSPLSIKYALGMLSDATAGMSHAQIAAILGNYTPKIYTNNENYSLANAFFVKNGFNVKDEFVSTLNRKYAAELKYDNFQTADAVNNWVSNKTYSIIDRIVDDKQVKGLDFILANALAIDMEWVKQIHPEGSKASVHALDVKYAHQNYEHLIVSLDGAFGDDKTYDYSHKLDFDGVSQKVKSVELGATINNYDIVSDLGESSIRNMISAEYTEWLNKASEETKSDCGVSTGSEIADQFIDDLKKVYGDAQQSTDFLLYDSDGEKVFAKDLKTYNGMTLQYIAVMPKEMSLQEYLKILTAKGLNNIISKLKDIKAENFEQGYITKINGYIPLFSYDTNLDLIDDLKTLGVTDIFDIETADFSPMMDGSEALALAKHGAKIDFSNDGIKAGAATAMGGARAAAPICYDHKFDVKVKEINLDFDKPYLYLIRDKDTGEVWFVGTVYQPTLAD